MSYQTEFDEHFSGASFALRAASLFRLTGTVRRPAPASSMIPLSPDAPDVNDMTAVYSDKVFSIQFLFNLANG